jgi:hypothetical protein
MKFEKEESDIAYYLVNKQTGQILKPGDSSVIRIEERIKNHLGDLRRKHGITEWVAVVYEVDRGHRSEVENGLRLWLLRKGENLPVDHEGKRSAHIKFGQGEPAFRQRDFPQFDVTYPLYIFGKRADGNGWPFLR